MIISALVGAFIAKKMEKANYEIYVEQAKAKAKAIEHEAEIMLENTKSKAKEIELAAKNEYELKEMKLKQEYENKINEILKKEEEIEKLLQEQLNKDKELKKAYKNIEKKEIALEKLKKEYEKRLKEIQDRLKNVAGLTKEEAKNLLLEKTKESLQGEIAHLTRKIIKETEENAKKKAAFIIAQATTNMLVNLQERDL